MIIGSISGDLRTHPDRSAAPASRSDCVPSAPQRAVVAVTPVEQAGPAALNQPDASFVAHLIATAAGSPQSRGLSQATPDHARAAYATTARRTDAPGVRDRTTVSRTA